MMRGGPGLGNILATQNDYNQAVKGGGTGDYHTIVLAPSSVQEAADLTRLAFELSDKYRNPAMILADGTIGQMVESVEFPEPIDPSDIPERDYALTGCKGRPPRKAEPKNSAEELENHNLRLQEKYQTCMDTEKRSESILTDDAEIVVVSFGFVSRLAHEMVAELRAEGIKAGLFRPITLWPFDDDALKKAVENAKAVVVLEHNAGMMCSDIRMYLEGQKPIYFHGRMGGSIINTDSVKAKIRNVVNNKEDWRELHGKEGIWKTC